MVLGCIANTMSRNEEPQISRSHRNAFRPLSSLSFKNWDSTDHYRKDGRFGVISFQVQTEDLAEQATQFMRP